MSQAPRSKARERKKEREDQRRRSQQMTIIGAVVAIVVVVAILFIVANLPADAPVPEEALTRYTDLITSTTNEGFPRLGNPNAPVAVVEFASFSCPGCESFHATTFPSLLPRIASGEINFTYMPMLTGSVANPEGAARTALCASEQNKFWQMHDVLFNWHSTFGNNAFIGNRLPAAAQALGLNMDAFNQCFSSDRVGDLISLALSKGVSATPTIQVNGATLEGVTLDVITEAIDLGGPFNNLEAGTISGTSGSPETTATEIATESATQEAVVTEAVTEASTQEVVATEAVTEASATETATEASTQAP